MMIKQILKTSAEDLLNTRFLNTEEAAKMLNMSPETLTGWRHYKRDDLPYIKFKNRIFYHIEDVEGLLKRKNIDNYCRKQRNELYKLRVAKRMKPLRDES